MAKQKIKNTRKLPVRGEAAADVALAEAAAPAKGVRKSKSRPRQGRFKAAGRPKRAGKIKLKVQKGGSSATVEKATTDPVAPLRTPRPGRLIKAIGRLKQRRVAPLERLEIAIDEVRLGGRASPRTRKLQTSGIPKMAQKVIEEAGEMAIEAIQGNKAALVNETVDLFYNMMVLLSAAGVTLEALWTEMERRELTLGMAEKLPKISDPDG